MDTATFSTAPPLSLPIPLPDPISPPSPGGLLARLRHAARAVLVDRREPLLELERQLGRSLRSGREIVLGSAGAPLTPAGDLLPAVVRRLRTEPPIALRLVVSALHPDRDADLLAVLDERHTIAVDVVARDVEAVASLETAAALASRGLAVRLVTPIEPGVNDRPSDLADLARAARDVGALDWVLAGRAGEAVRTEHRLAVLQLGLGEVAGRG